MRVVLIGHSGYWGQKLARVLSELGHQWHAIDQSNIDSFDHLSTLDAAIIATPPDSHYSWAMKCMKAGMDVLVEKPMGMTLGQAKVMQDCAEKHGIVLSVDSTFCHTKSFSYLKSLHKPLLSYQSIRLAPPMPQAQIPAGWDLIVHDLAILQGLGGLPSYCRPGHEDGSVAQCAFELPSGGSAFILASRAWPTKERSITLHFPGHLFLWNLDGLVEYRDGLPVTVVAEDEEPLRRLLLDFELRCVDRRLRGVTDGLHGAEVVECLERLFPRDAQFGVGGRRVGNGLHSGPAVKPVPLQDRQ